MKTLAAYIRKDGTPCAYLPAYESRSAVVRSLNYSEKPAAVRVIGMQTRIDPEKIVYRDLSSPFLEITPIEKETLIKRNK